VLERGGCAQLQTLPRVSKSPHRTFKDVQDAFESRRILNCSRRELEELLVTAAADAPTEPAGQARAREMSETMRELLAAKSRPRGSRLAAVAALLALLALFLSGAQAYYSRTTLAAEHESVAELGDYVRATIRDEAIEDPRTQLTLEELARRAPTLSTGTLQAWWAGEQARNVQRLEALAKRQTLAGDREGAARTVRRADAIRSGIAPLAKFEQPPAN
jgi:hypothetical protein